MAQTDFIHPDPTVRRAVFGVTLISLAIVTGVIIGLTSSNNTPDDGWADYYTPVRIGNITKDGANVTRLVSDDGHPTANDDETITFASGRCGPDNDITPVISERTWAVSGEELFIRFQGQAVSIQLEPAPDCTIIERDLTIPPDVVAAATNNKTGHGALVEVWFLITPSDLRLTAKLIKSEPFHLYDPNLVTVVETVPLRP